MKSVCCYPNGKKRTLTPYGKITVLKALVVSKLVYLFINLPDPTEQFLSDLDKMLYRFLWDDKPSKIKKTVVIKPYDEGGLKMINVFSFLSSLKLSWLRRLHCNSQLSNITLALYPELRNVVLLGDCYSKTLVNTVNNYFWKDVLKHYVKLCNHCLPNDVHEMLSECIFYNSNILRNNTSIFFNNWFDNEIRKIRDLLNENGNFMSFDQFKNAHPNVPTDFLTYQGILNAIRCYLRKSNITLSVNFRILETKSWFVLCKGNKAVRTVLDSNLMSAASITKWNVSFPKLHWKHIFNHCYLTTKDTQLRWFQTRLLHRLIPTNKFLFTRKLADSPICSFCELEEDTLSHLFWYCDYSHAFWLKLQQLLHEECTHCDSFFLSEELVLFGIKNNTITDIAVDYIVLSAKFYLYKCKLQNVKPNFDAFRRILKWRYVVERSSAAANDQSYNFDVNWCAYRAIVDDGRLAQS